MADEPEDREAQNDTETRLDRLQAAIDELTTLLPRATGPTAGLPGRIADALAGIDERLAAVERMGREQFELDQRLTALDEAMGNLAAPFAELAPKLRHVDQLVDWMGRIEQRLQDGATPTTEGTNDEAAAEQLRVVREALAATVARSSETAEALTRVEQAIGELHERPAPTVNPASVDGLAARVEEAVTEVARRMTAVQETASAVRAEHATRLVDLQRLVEQSRLTPSSTDGFAAVADAVTRLERRVDAIASLLETLVSDDPRQRTAERVTERIDRLREVAGGVGDAIREELRRRRTGRPPSIGTG